MSIIENVAKRVGSNGSKKSALIGPDELQKIVAKVADMTEEEFVNNQKKESAMYSYNRSARRVRATDLRNDMIQTWTKFKARLFTLENEMNEFINTTEKIGGAQEQFKERGEDLRSLNRSIDKMLGKW